MGTLKLALVAIAGTVVGLVTIRSIRKRRSKDTEDELRAVKHEAPETATEHAKAAVEHTRRAVRKTKIAKPER